MKNKFQHDFFGNEYRDREEQRFPFLGKYSKHRLLPHLRVPTEYIVIAGIGMLVLVIIAYAIGVEKGKRFRAKEYVERDEPETQSIVNKEVTTTTKASRPAEKAPEEPVKPPEKSPGAIYRIQLASFRDLAMTKREIEKLKKRGFDVSFEKKGSWYQVYAEGYGSMEEAGKAKKELAKYYEDCYIRRTK
ncbi:MAG: SPOR domain-containing protein [Candidatus Omnitrophota bacterium]